MKGVLTIKGNRKMRMKMKEEMNMNMNMKMNEERMNGIIGDDECQG